MRSNDGEGKPGTVNPPHSDKQALCQSGIIAARVSPSQQLCPLRRSRASSPKGRAFGSIISVSYTHLDVYKRQALDGVNPFDRSFREALEAGVTAAAVSPGSANPIGGQIALLKTAGRRVDDMILKAPLAIKFALGENPKSVYHDKDETPVTRMATAGIIREELYKAKRCV